MLSAKEGDSRNCPHRAKTRGPHLLGVIQKLDYPDATDGTRWAAKARKMASKLTPEQETEHFLQAMVNIYGVQPKETTGAGL